MLTESCGHIKCMNCLLSEQQGCLACSNGDKHKSDFNSENGDATSSGEVDASSDIDKIENNDNDKSSNQLNNVKKQNNSNPIKCPIDGCGKTFTSRSHYKYHMRVHQNVCDVCKKGFYARHNLNRHMLLHTNERNHICPVCKKGFLSSFILKQHVNIHTGAKPHQCKICGKRFRDRSNYYKHVSNIHGAKKSGMLTSQKKRFKCPQCDETFRFGRDVRRHSTVHLESRPFRCKICPDKQFKRKDNLERHIRNYHPNYATSAATEINQDAINKCMELAEKTTSKLKPIDKNIEEKNILKTLNPLPPLSKEIIEKHLGEPLKADEHDKSYILQANNARESVIVEQKNPVKKEDSHIGYVHKIRKANSLANKKDIKLPPIDEAKMMELEVKKNIGIGSPPRNTDLYKMILYEPEATNPDGEVQNSVPATSKHWRTKLKLNVRWNES